MQGEDGGWLRLSVLTEEEKEERAKREGGTFLDHTAFELRMDSHFVFFC